MTTRSPSEPKERPILFGAQLVRAILAGTKTQTRRIVRLKHPECADAIERNADGTWSTGEAINMSWAPAESGIRCPYAVGDRLWVRESFWQRVYFAHHGDVEPVRGKTRDTDARFFSTDKKPEDSDTEFWESRPSIQMGRWAARIFLEVTAVRAERLQAISEEDAKAEGLDNGPGGGSRLYPSSLSARAPLGHREVFRQLWDRINGERASWESNPFVWVISFRRLES